MATNSIPRADLVILVQTTKVNEVLKAIARLPFVPHDEEYRFRLRSTNLLKKWGERIGPSDEGQAPTSTPPAVRKGILKKGVNWQRGQERDAHREKESEEQWELFAQQESYKWEGLEDSEPYHARRLQRQRQQ